MYVLNAEALKLVTGGSGESAAAAPLGAAESDLTADGILYPGARGSGAAQPDRSLTGIIYPG
jgi:hypothetical protein